MDTPKLLLVTAMASALIATSFARGAAAQDLRNRDYGAAVKTVDEIAQSLESLRPYFSDVSHACQRVRPYEHALADKNGIDPAYSVAYPAYLSCCPQNATANALGAIVGGLKVIPVPSSKGIPPIANRLIQEIFGIGTAPLFSKIEEDLGTLRAGIQSQCVKVAAFALGLPKADD